MVMLVTLWQRSDAELVYFYPTLTPAPRFYEERLEVSAAFHFGRKNSLPGRIILRNNYIRMEYPARKE